MKNTVWCSEPYQLFDYDYDRTIKDKSRDVNSLRAQVSALQNVTTDAAKARRAQLQAQLSEAEEDLNETRYDHQIEMQQQGYEQLSEDMQKALDDAVKLINGDQKVLQDTAASMLAQLETNHIDEKAVIADIVNGTGTKIHDETQAMIDDTLTATAALSEDAQGIANAVSAIATLLGQNPANTAQALSSILMELGSNGTLSQAIKEFADANGIKINETGLDGVITAIAAPYDEKGKAAQLFNEIKGVIKGDSDSLYNSLFNESNGLAGTISAISSVLGTEQDSTFTRIQQLLDNLGATGTLSKAITEFINEQGKDVDDGTQSLINQLTAPYDENGKATQLFAQLNETLNGEKSPLKLLSDLFVKEKTNEDGTVTRTLDIASAIDWQPVTEEISKLNPVVNITVNSADEELKQLLRDIEDKYLKVNSGGGTNGETVDDQAIAKAVSDKLNALPDQAKLSDADTVANARKAYDSLTENQKNLVDKDALHKLEQDELWVEDAKERKRLYDQAMAEKAAMDAAAKKEQKEREKNLLVKSIDKALSYGKPHKKKPTQAERDSHPAIWEYLVDNYKIDGNNKVYAQLAKALNVPYSKTVTGQEKKNILKALKAARKKYGFASGTKRVGKNMDAWTNEDWENLGAEMIVRKSDGAILTPLKANDSVIPANLADNLFKWGAISPDKFLSNPFLGKMGDMPSNANVTNQVDQKVEMHFDSLFTIQGDVNADVMDRLEEFGKALTSDRNFQQNVVKFVTKDFVRESKKQGGFR